MNCLMIQKKFKHRRSNPGKLQEVQLQKDLWKLLNFHNMFIVSISTTFFSLKITLN